MIPFADRFIALSGFDVPPNPRAGVEGSSHVKNEKETTTN